MAKKKRKFWTPEDRARHEETLRLLEERIAYQRRKRAEEAAAERGG